MHSELLQTQLRGSALAEGLSLLADASVGSWPSLFAQLLWLHDCRLLMPCPDLTGMYELILAPEDFQVMVLWSSAE